jgi:hypothetical protein
MTVTGQSRAGGHAYNRVAQAEAPAFYESCPSECPTIQRRGSQVTVRTGYTWGKEKKLLTLHSNDSNVFLPGHSDRNSQQGVRACQGSPSTAVEGVRPPRGRGFEGSTNSLRKSLSDPGGIVCQPCCLMSTCP